MSALCAPAAVSGPMRSVWPCAYPTFFTFTPAAVRPLFRAAAPSVIPAMFG